MLALGRQEGQNHRYTYLRSLYYDKFEQRAEVVQGNGVTTAYTYNAQNRRLDALTAMRQVAGARVGADFMSDVENASKNSGKLVIVGMRGDKNLANDSRLLAHTIGSQFGDRSYEAIVGAIQGKYGSLEKFYEKFPNVSVQPAAGAHGGGGNRPSTQEAITRGVEEIDKR